MIACIEVPTWLAIGFVILGAIVVSMLIVVVGVVATMVERIDNG